MGALAYRLTVKSVSLHKKMYAEKNSSKPKPIRHNICHDYTTRALLFLRTNNT